MPRFPFKRSVGADLRDLFGHDRLEAQSRDLGYSSLSPGEGSFDIYDDAGNEVARYGHHAGKAGFLVPAGGGSWATVQEHVASTVEAGTAPLAGRMTTAEGRLDSHASSIGAAEGVNTTQTGRLDSHASRLGTAEGRLDSHASRLGALEGDVSSLESQMQSMSSLYGTLAQAHNELKANYELHLNEFHSGWPNG